MDISIRDILLLLVALLLAGLAITYGVLLLFWPEQFLRLNDFLNPGSRGWLKAAGWRREVKSFEYKALGIGFVIGGVFFVVIVIRKLVALCKYSAGC